MFNVDATLLARTSLLSPVTLFQAGPEAVDHPSAWLDMLPVLPCVDSDRMCLVAGFDTGRRISVRVPEAADPVLADSGISGVRRFTLNFSDSEVSCDAVAEFAISATADQLHVQLGLVSADESFQDHPDFVAALALTLPAILSRAAVDVIAVVYRSLSPDLADTAVHLTLSVPDARYAEISALGLAELSLLEAELIEAGARFEATMHVAFADAPKEAAAAQVSTKVALTAAQRLALALNLVTLREARGLTQLEVADKALGLSKSHAAVSRLERGILTDVEVERLSKLATFFEMEIGALLDNHLTSGEPNQTEEDKGPSIFDRDCDFTPSSNFGRRLTLARTAAGLSRLALAKKLGHMDDLQTVKSWEDEKAAPRRTSFIELGMALEVPVSWLMFGRRVATPDRALALRLTAMQKLYGLTNGEIGSLVEASSDAAALEKAGKRIGLLSRARHDATPKVLRALSVALQVPEDWISPPNTQSPLKYEQSLKIATAHADKGPDSSGSARSLQARKLLSDLIDLLDMGLISDKDARDLRSDLVSRFTANILRPKKHQAALAAAAAG